MLVESIGECEVAIFPAWHQELPVPAGQAYFPNRVYSIGSDHSALRPFFLSVVAPLALSHATASCSCQ